MSFRAHHHLLSRLVLAHHSRPTFSFSESVSSHKAVEQVRRKAVKGQVAALQSQLSEARQLLIRLRKSLGHDQYVSLVDKIGLLEKKIKEKRKKLDLTGPLP